MRPVAWLMVLTAILTLAVSAGAAAPAGEGFESGDLVGWTVAGEPDALSVIQADEHARALVGRYMLRLGTPRDDGQPMGLNQVYRDFDVPSTPLVIAYNVFTYDIAGLDAFSFEIRTRDGSDTVLAIHSQTAWGSTRELKTSGWKVVTLDLSQHAGKPARLVVGGGGTVDTSLPTWAYFDMGAVAFDSTPPLTTAKVTPEPGPSGWSTGDVSVHLSASTIPGGPPLREIRYRIGNGPEVVSPANSVDVAFRDEGVFDLSYRSTDVAGNIEDVRTLAVRIDRTPPVSVADVDPASPNGRDGWYTVGPIVHVSATDPLSGVEKIEFSTDQGATWQAFTGPIPLDRDGVHTVQHRAVDVAGNAENAKNLTVKVDRTPPVTVDDAPQAWRNADVVVRLSASDETSGVLATIHALDDQPDRTGDQLTVHAEGVHTISYRSEDRAGNIEAVRTTTVRIDKTAPQATARITGRSGSNGWYVGPLTVEIACADAFSGPERTEYSLDGGSTWHAYASPLRFDRSGWHTLSYRCYDRAGNVSPTAVQQLQIDLEAPVTVAATDPSPNAAGWHRSDITIRLTANDLALEHGQAPSGVASLTYQVDSAAPVTVAGAEAEFQVTADGVHEVRYWATDAAGNAEAAKTLTVRLDKTAPEVRVFWDGASQSIVLQPVDTLSGPGQDARIAPPADDRPEDPDAGGGAKQGRAVTVSDAAGNTVTVLLRVKLDGRQAHVRLLSVAYNAAPAVAFDANELKYEWAFAQAGVPRAFEQKASVHRAWRSEAHYDARADETRIQIHGESGKPQRQTRPGFASIGLQTSRGVPTLLDLVVLP